MKIIVSIVLAMAGTQLHAQENESASSVYQQQLEQQAAQEETESEDDSYWQYLEQRRRHRLNLNKAGEDELRELNLLSDWQIHNLLRYRRLFGDLLKIYELQAIPGWDLATIRNLLPYVSVQEGLDIPADWRNWLLKGESRWLVRFSQVLEKAKGFTDSGSHYTGSPLKLLFRYKYQYRDQLQYGISGDKDAGEQFLAGKQKSGFDFYSFHFFLRRLGIIKALALGDFIINLGQGLVHWQGQAFKKSATVMNIKRQSPVLKPYTAAGEFNFHRGIGITMQKKNWQSTIFASWRKWSAAVQQDEMQNNFVSSVQLSGLHRTNTELANRNAMNAFATGGNIQWRNNRGHIGMNAIHHAFSIPFRSSGEPYDLYAMCGKSWLNYSVDYSYTYANCHMYGEMAADKNHHIALVQGLLVSADPKIDVSMVYRRIGPAYQAMSGNAFTENTQPNNESGLFSGISIRPAYGWRIDAYADFLRFPWLKYRVDAPSSGCEYLLQVSWTPNKQTEIISRFRVEQKGLNHSTDAAAIPIVEQVLRKNWRSQVSFQVSKELLLQNRVDIIWYAIGHSSIKKTGFLCFQDIQFEPANRPWKAALRLQYFESDDYDTRLYAYEHSVMYNFSLPAFFNKGVRWNASFQYKASLNKKKGRAGSVIGFNISQSVYSAGTVIGSGQDQLYMEIGRASCRERV